MQAFYHSVETFGTVDGPGIRYVLFLNGCALHCAFCHNPDTWSLAGKTIEVEDVLTDVKRYRRFYEASGGGLTLSGGEPLLQPEFAAALFAGCQEAGIHTLLDTAGYVPTAAFAAVLPFTDSVSFCVKAARSAVHRQLTGVDNALIVDNLRFAAARRPLVVRYVIVPGVNDAEADIEALGELVNSLPEKVAVELLPYHTLGRHKWENLGLPYAFGSVPPASPADVARVGEKLVNLGVTLLHCEAGLTA